jgi:NodT family efflux transporter outer membrane factor (OMF) lipoprotein
MTDDLDADALWWQQFHDSTLDSLISGAIDHNYDVAIAAKRIEIARQTLSTTRAGYWPQLSVSADWERARSATTQTVSSYRNANMTMSWEVDLFGKIRSAANRDKALLKVSRADYASTMIALCANVADNYISLRMYQEQAATVDAHCREQSEIVDMVRARHTAGLASALDVAQALTVYYSTCATLPTLKSNIRTCINAIALLLGTTPDEMAPSLASYAPIPRHLHLISGHIPLDILRRRPDVVAAEMQIEAYASALTVADKAYLPSFSINGSIGVTAHHTSDLFTHNSLTYEIAPTLTWTAFDGLARHYQRSTAKTQLQLGIDSYQQTILTAINEADNAMAAYVGALAQWDFIVHTVQQCRRAYELSLDRYKQGLSPFSDVATAQGSLLQYQVQEISSRASSLSDIIQLYKAMGGGWDPSTISK